MDPLLQEDIGPFRVLRRNSGKVSQGHLLRLCGGHLCGGKGFRLEQLRIQGGVHADIEIVFGEVQVEWLEPYGWRANGPPGEGSLQRVFDQLFPKWK